MSAAWRWRLASTAANEAADPSQLRTVDWSEARVPGTVADHDDADWWYRCEFSGDGRYLRFEGLATLAQVWLNGELVLESSNMFQRHVVDVGARLRAQNELVICFRSLNAALARKRPRPRWKTRLVRHQQLRWFRTTLLGRIPGWTPPVAPVGPWREIALDADAHDVRVHAYLDGDAGVVEASCVAESGRLVIAEHEAELRLHEGRLCGVVRIENARRWWPHTHGEPVLHPCSLELDGKTIACDPVGFRTIEAVTGDGGFALHVNGVPVFCRGACWTGGAAGETLALLRDAGANMIRVGGTMVYEEDAFYRACDELGILVWQDFMFANMDYPAEDPEFLQSVRVEATQQLQRLRSHPSVAVYCGNSEVEQQAAMFGAPPELWRNALFAEVLPGLCREWHPGSVYVPSTPSGGVLPFQTGTGVTHYYGVGAYLRPLADARRANVRFTPECLGFANVPEPEVVDAVFGGDAPALHDPRWKERTPRDTGAGWDFEDVRDHYLRELFSDDPMRLRYSDTQRYLELSRVTTGEVMAEVFSEWRSARSGCNGGLVWFARDLWPGAGWGILDSRGLPKACFHFLRRVWQPRTVVITDEGLDGIHLHVINEIDSPLHATLELTLLRDAHVVTAHASTPCTIAPRSTMELDAEALLGGFHDTAYAYRFGPPRHDVAIATLLDGNGSVLAEAFHFPVAIEPKRAEHANVTATARPMGEGEWELALQSDRFLYAVRLDWPASDNYFHLAPGRTKTVFVRAPHVRGSITALNLGDAIPVVVKP
jgi:beta-mannosidase